LNQYTPFILGAQ